MKIKREEQGHIFVVAINRPELRNAVDDETAQQLADAFTYFEHADHLKVGILTGMSDHFCAGADLQAIARNDSSGPKLELSGRAPLGVSRMLLSKPVIAAVEGYAVAGGLELALWCDMRIASASAIFGVFCRRFGVPLVDGGTFRLPRLIGESRAMDMILTGRPVAADEAFSFGLVNRLCEAGEALDVALALANQIAKFPQKCMRSDRLNVKQQWNLSDLDALQSETLNGMKVIESGETLHGAKAFKSGVGHKGKF